MSTYRALLVRRTVITEHAVVTVAATSAAEAAERSLYLGPYAWVEDYRASDPITLQSLNPLVPLAPCVGGATQVAPVEGLTRGHKLIA